MLSGVVSPCLFQVPRPEENDSRTVLPHSRSTPGCLACPNVPCSWESTRRRGRDEGGKGHPFRSTALPCSYVGHPGVEDGESGDHSLESKEKVKWHLTVVNVLCTWPKLDPWWPARPPAPVTSENPSYPKSERPVSSRLSYSFLLITGSDHDRVEASLRQQWQKRRLACCGRRPLPGPELNIPSSPLSNTLPFPASDPEVQKTH